MTIHTSRFGEIEVDESRFIMFKQGILGFPNEQEYALIQTAEGSGFYWLQAVARPDLAFVVCDPRLFVQDYRAPIRSEELEQLNMKDPNGAQVFIVVNKVEDLLTGNLQGPLVVNLENREAKQLVLSDKRYSTRHPLMRLPQSSGLAVKTA